MILELIIAAVGAAWLFTSSGKKTKRPDEISKIPTPNIEITDLKRKITDRVRTRGIEYLVHFTQKANLPSIKKHGLMSRRALEKSAISFSFNDEQRFDGCLNSVSLSVTSTNYKMFWSLQKKKSVS